MVHISFTFIIPSFFFHFFFLIFLTSFTFLFSISPFFYFSFFSKLFIFPLLFPILHPPILTFLSSSILLSLHFSPPPSSYPYTSLFLHPPILTLLSSSILLSLHFFSSQFFYSYTFLLHRPISTLLPPLQHSSTFFLRTSTFHKSHGFFPTRLNFLRHSTEFSSYFLALTPTYTPLLFRIIPMPTVRFTFIFTVIALNMQAPYQLAHLRMGKPRKQPD